MRAFAKIEVVVNLEVPDQVIIERLEARRTCRKCRAIYNLKNVPPKVEGKDDETGEPLVQRDDDKEETVKKRLDVYHDQTEPLIDYYKSWESSGDAGAPKYVHINGVGTLDAITGQIVGELDKL